MCLRPLHPKEPSTHRVSAVVQGDLLLCSKPHRSDSNPGNDRQWSQQNMASANGENLGILFAYASSSVLTHPGWCLANTPTKDCVCQHNVRKISYVMLDASGKYYTIRWILGTRGAKKVFIPLWFRSFNPSEMQVVYWTYESRNRDHLPMKRTTISLQDLSPKHCTKDTKPAPSPPANLPDDFLMFTQCQPMTWIVMKCWDRIKLTSASHVHPCVH